MRSTRSGVEAIGNRIQLVLGIHAQIGSLGQVLPQQPIRVLAGAPLPRAVRITKVDLHPRVGRQLLVATHLLALVVGEAVAHGSSN